MSLTLTLAEQRQLTALADTFVSPLAAEQPAQWRESVDAAMRQVFRCDHVMFVTPEQGAVQFRSPSIGREVLQVFAELTTPDTHTGLFASKDPVVDTWFRARRADRLEVFTESINDHMLQRLGHDMRRSEIANNVWRGGMYDFFGLMTEAAGAEMMLITGFERRGVSRLGDEAIRQRLQLVLPAFRAGHHAAVRFAAQRRALANTLDFLDDALLLFDAAGRELHRNRACAALLAAEPETASLLTICRQVAFAITAPRLLAASPGAYDSVVPMERTMGFGDRRYLARAVPAPTVLGVPDGAVLLSLSRARPTPLSDEALRQRFGLTPREIEVVRLLGQGHRNSEIALRLAVREATARNHTERALLKLRLRSRNRVGPLLRGEPLPEPE